MAKEPQFKLTTREFKFADAILRGLSSIDAVRESGYKASTEGALRVQASTLLAKPNVAEYIRLERELIEYERRKKIEVDDLWITQQFKEVYERCMQRKPVMRFDRDAGGMVQEVDEDGEGVWTFDSTGANRALENIAKHIGYYEIDNKQRAPKIVIGAVQNNIHNYFFEEEQQENKVDGTECSDVSNTD